MHKYTIKNLKSFLGREGHGFNIDLYRNGVKVAFVQDMADGGEIRFDWVDHKNTLPMEFPSYNGIKGSKHIEMVPVEEVLLLNHISTIEEYKDGTRSDMDCFVSSLVDDYENEKRNKKKCKNHIMFLSNDGKTYSIKGTYNEANKTFLLTRYPDIVEFINEKYLEKV